MCRPGRHLYEGRMGTRGPSPLAHTTSYADTRAFMRRRARVALYNRLFAQSIVTPRCGVGGEIPPWGKGLKEQPHERFYFIFFIKQILHNPLQVPFNNFDAFLIFADYPYSKPISW